MIAFQMQDIKAFMSRLLLSSAFDAFLVVEGGVTTFSSFQIDGRLRPDYYSREEQEASGLEGRRFARWQEIRPFCLELIKGKHTPLYFKIVFQLDKEDTRRLLAEHNLSLRREDIFGRLTNSKRRAKALYAQSQEYRQAVQTQVIASVANLYYTLLMLDAQYNISMETAEKWEESVTTMRAMMDAGMTNAAGVAQTEANYYSIQASLYDLRYQIREIENTLAALLGETPRSYERGRLEDQVLPEELIVGVPLQLLSNRPDVKSAEYSLAQAHYATAGARSALYPSLNLSGLVGWTNNGGAAIVNPGKLLLQAAASLTQPIFNAGMNRAQLKIAKAQQEEALLSFQQTLLNAGGEVNNALAKAQSARAKADYQAKQVASLETAVESTQLLMRHGSTTYLEVLTAQQSLLSAQLTQVSNRFDEIQAIVDLYHALGGGRDMEEPETEAEAK